MRSMTYGTLPTFNDYEAAFDRECEDGEFSFGNDSRVGTCRLSKHKLWDELQKAVKESETFWEDFDPSSGNPDGDDSANWAGTVLNVLGFEWI